MSAAENIIESTVAHRQAFGDLPIRTRSVLLRGLKVVLDNSKSDEEFDEATALSAVLARCESQKPKQPAQFVDIDESAPIDGLPTPAPCPFCGFHEWAGIVTNEASGPNDVAAYHVQCDGCFAEGPLCASKLEAAERWNIASERVPLRAPEALRKALYLQQRQIFQAQGVIQCVIQALYNHFGDWPANLPQWNLALETADEMLGKVASAISDDELLEDAHRIAKQIEEAAELTQEAA